MTAQYTFSADDHHDDEDQPGCSDKPLDPAQPMMHGFAIDGKASSPQAGCRTGPAAPESTHEQRREKLESKDDQAAVDDAL